MIISILVYLDSTTFSKCDIGFFLHRGQNSKQINIAKYVSKFLICGAQILDKCVKSQKKSFVHCPFLQSQAK